MQPPLDESVWETPIWDLTDRNGRWYGRGAADCKGNIAVHLTALRALGDDLPVTVKIVGEGSEEQGTGGLEAFVPEHPELLAADAILVCDAGNVAVGQPSLTSSLRGLANVWVTVRTLSSAMHSGMFGGPFMHEAVVEQLFEVLAAHKFHHQKHAPAIFDDGVAMRNIGQLGIDEQLGFKAKLFAYARVGVQHFLDGALIAEVHIGGAIDTGVTATADHFFDAIAFCEYRAGLKRRSGRSGLRHWLLLTSTYVQADRDAGKQETPSPQLRWGGTGTAYSFMNLAVNRRSPIWVAQPFACHRFHTPQHAV